MSDIEVITEYHVSRIIASCGFLNTDRELKLMSKAMRSAMLWGISNINELSKDNTRYEYPPLSIVKAKPQDLNEYQ